MVRGALRDDRQNKLLHVTSADIPLFQGVRVIPGGDEHGQHELEVNACAHPTRTPHDGTVSENGSAAKWYLPEVCEGMKTDTQNI